MTRKFDPLHDPSLLDYFDAEPFAVNADGTGGCSMVGGAVKLWPRKSLKLGQPSAITAILDADNPTYIVVKASSLGKSTK